MKNDKVHWIVPLIITIGFFILDLVVSRGQVEFKAVLATKVYSYFGVVIFYNGFIVNRHKPKFWEIQSTSPFLFLILGCLLPTVFVLKIVAVLILLTLGTLFIMLSLGYQIQEKRKREVCSITTIAAVTGNQLEYTKRRKSGDIPMPTYRPILSYTANGVQKEVVYDDGFPSPMAVGRRVEIIYNPENPEQFYFLDDKVTSAVRIGALAFLIVGICIDIVGLTVGVFIFLK